MTPNDLVLTENGTEWICPTCTTVIPLDMEYCPNCGQYRGELITPEPELSLVEDHIREPEPEPESEPEPELAAESTQNEPSASSSCMPEAGDAIDLSTNLLSEQGCSSPSDNEPNIVDPKAINSLFGISHSSAPGRTLSDSDILVSPDAINNFSQTSSFKPAPIASDSGSLVSPDAINSFTSLHQNESQSIQSPTPTHVDVNSSTISSVSPLQNEQASPRPLPRLFKPTFWTYLLGPLIFLIVTYLKFTVPGTLLSSIDLAFLAIFSFSYGPVVGIFTAGAGYWLASLLIYEAPPEFVVILGMAWMGFVFGIGSKRIKTFRSLKGILTALFFAALSLITGLLILAAFAWGGLDSQNLERVWFLFKQIGVYLLVTIPILMLIVGKRAV